MEDPRRAKVHVPAVATPRNFNVSVEGDNFPPRLTVGFPGSGKPQVSDNLPRGGPHMQKGESRPGIQQC